MPNSGNLKNSKTGQSLLDRVHEPPDPNGLDLLTVDVATLEKFYIPPRPDPTRQPEAFRVWDDFFGQSAQFVSAGIKLAQAEYQLNAGTVMGALQSRFDTSSNWSGAYVVPTGGNMVVAIEGRWIVPTPALPPPQEQPGPNAVYACSTWIGLDGQRRYLNSSLPQIGTTQQLTISAANPPVVSTYAWFQWWDRPSGGYYIYLSNFAVAPGDEVACLVWLLTGSRVTAVIYNLTTNAKPVRVWADAPTVTPPGVQLTVSGATAEWILERPTKFGTTDDLYPFPNYGSATFLDCVALTGPGPLLTQSVEDLQSARLIRMYDTFQNPMRTQYISMPVLPEDEPDDTTAQVNYGDFK